MSQDVKWFILCMIYGYGFLFLFVPIDFGLGLIIEGLIGGCIASVIIWGSFIIGRRRLTF